MHDTVLPREFSCARLRRLRLSDCTAFQAYRALPELGRYQGWSPMSDAQAKEFLEQVNRARLFTPGQWVQLGIAELESDSLIGDIGLYLSEDEMSGQIGYTLQPSAQGRGIASCAVVEALEIFFATTTVTRVLGITDARNIPSIRLLERVGFKLIESRDVIFRGEPCTELVYGLER